MIKWFNGSIFSSSTLILIYALPSIYALAQDFPACLQLHSSGQLEEAKVCYSQLALSESNALNRARVYYNYAQVLDSQKQPGATLSALLAMRQISALGDERIVLSLGFVAGRSGIENLARKLPDTKFLGYLSLRQWLAAPLVSLLLAFLFSLAGLFSLVCLYKTRIKSSETWKNKWCTSALVSYFLFSVVGISFYKVQNQLQGWGAVSSKTADVYSGPNPVVFSLVTQLPEGTLVKNVEVSDSEKREGWKLISDRSTELGWIRENEVAFLGL